MRCRQVYHLYQATSATRRRQRSPRTFVKQLANNASLLEAAKANTDARARISTKRDALAAQVGLSAGSTFDAISAQLASGAAFKKFATGTFTGATVTVSNLTFVPRTVIAYNTHLHATVIQSLELTPLADGAILGTSELGNTKSSSRLDGLTNGFTISFRQAVTGPGYWVAFG